MDHTISTMGDCPFRPFRITRIVKATDGMHNRRQTSVQLLPLDHGLFGLDVIAPRVSGPRVSASVAS
jgi:hypothetical protein